MGVCEGKGKIGKISPPRKEILKLFGNEEYRPMAEGGGGRVDGDSPLWRWRGEKTEELMRVECEAAQLTWVLIGLNCHQIVAITEECKNINF